MTEAQTSHRPAEQQLPSEIARMRQMLLEGFRSRAEVLRWLQQLSVRTLGQIPTQRYERLGAEFKPDENAQEGVLLAAFLVEEGRTRELSHETAMGVRRQWAATVLAPTTTDSFRSLRKDAGEYIGKSEDDASDGYDPEGDHPFIMRPALEELDTFQRQALVAALDGLDSRDAILDWGDDLVQATRGERIDHGTGETFVRRLYNDPCGDLIMCSEEPSWRRFREHMLCKWVLPAFNDAVQDLTKRTGEEPTESHSGDRKTRQL